MLLLGRLYDYRLLDMIELGIEKYQSRQKFKVPKISSYKFLRSLPWFVVADNLQVEGSSVCSKPCLLFTGDLFETDTNYIRLKNVLIGMTIKLKDFEPINFLWYIIYTIRFLSWT